MKKLILLVIMVLFASGLQTNHAQETKVSKKIYNPEANAQEEISKAIKQAKAEGKHVMVQVGGNWCSWCLLFHAYINEDADVKKMIDDNYVFVLLNTSQENKNKELLLKYKNPGRLGYPVFLILDGKGQLVHTQDSGLLEEGRGYNKNKVLTFLGNWSPKAMDLNNFR